ncbi:hypothetical protein [Thalassobaculum salexigens]|uniref:hypothetical protein n=1 Tax=Thalassobaculum salexigens TaxID=455360 RepID=UPI0012EBD0C8|nr:hypothetical protein [Thalassobaculum salexigens]
MHDQQYSVVAARRQAYDVLLWQVPALGIAAQGFLVSAALGAEVSAVVSTALFLFSFMVGLSVVWLFWKIRLHEVADSELLKEFEKIRSEEGFSVVHGQRVAGFSAYRLWLILLLAFTSVECLGTIIMYGRIPV